MSLYVKTEICWKYYKSLTINERESKTAKHLRCMCEVAIKLLEQNDKKEQELRGLRK